MMESYKVVLHERSLCGIGVPCEDIDREIGEMTFLPESVQAAEGILSAWGVPVIFDSPNSYKDGLSVTVEVSPRPGHNFDSAWVDFYPDYD